jgi:uncharacterized protein
MLILISPAKKLDTQQQVHNVNTAYSLPCFIDKASQLINLLKTYDEQMLIDLMGISPSLAKLNLDRFNTWDINKQLKPALFLFNGDVYDGINAQTLSKEQLEFTNKHLRILSGLYGVLKPLDNISPHRLEMGTKLKHSNGKDLYSFWQDKPSFEILNHMQEQDYTNIINLASDEYFKVINPHIKAMQNTIANINIVKIIFEQNKNGIYKNISFLTKYARGLMVRYIIDNKINTNIEQLKKFDINGYKYVDNLSDEQNLVFHKA